MRVKLGLSYTETNDYLQWMFIQINLLVTIIVQVEYFADDLMWGDAKTLYGIMFMW